MTKLIVFPGGFHPIHSGHLEVYKYLQKRFPNEKILLSATNAQTERPFSFEEKRTLAMAAGIPGSNFVQVKRPYNHAEYLDELDGASTESNTALIFVVSEKEFSEKEGRFDFTHKQMKSADSKAEYQNGDTILKIFPKTEESLKPMKSGVAYVLMVPMMSNGISASEIRDKYKNWSEEKRLKFIRSLYSESGDSSEIKAILDGKLLERTIKEFKQFITERFWEAHLYWGWFNENGKMILPTAEMNTSSGDFIHANLAVDSNDLKNEPYDSSRYSEYKSQMTDKLKRGWVRWYVNGPTRSATKFSMDNHQGTLTFHTEIEDPKIMKKYLDLLPTMIRKVESTFPNRNRKIFSRGDGVIAKFYLYNDPEYNPGKESKFKITAEGTNPTHVIRKFRNAAYEAGVDGLEEETLNEYFEELDYTYWGLFDPKNNMILPTKEMLDSKKTGYYHGNIFPKKIDRFAAYYQGWVRWFVKNTEVYLYTEYTSSEAKEMMNFIDNRMINLFNIIKTNFPKRDKKIFTAPTAPIFNYVYLNYDRDGLLNIEEDTGIYGDTPYEAKKKARNFLVRELEQENIPIPGEPKVMVAGEEVVSEKKHYTGYLREWGWITNEGEFIDGNKHPDANEHQKITGESYTSSFAKGWIRFMLTNSWVMQFEFVPRYMQKEDIPAIKRGIRERVDAYPANVYQFLTTRLVGGSWQEFVKSFKSENEFLAYLERDVFPPKVKVVGEAHIHGYPAWGWISSEGKIYTSSNDSKKSESHGTMLYDITKVDGEASYMRRGWVRWFVEPTKTSGNKMWFETLKTPINSIVKSIAKLVKEYGSLAKGGFAINNGDNIIESMSPSEFIRDIREIFRIEESTITETKHEELDYIEWGWISPKGKIYDGVKSKYGNHVDLIMNAAGLDPEEFLTVRSHEISNWAVMKWSMQNGWVRWFTGKDKDDETVSMDMVFSLPLNHSLTSAAIEGMKKLVGELPIAGFSLDIPHQLTFVTKEYKNFTNRQTKAMWDYLSTLTGQTQPKRFFAKLNKR